MLPPKPVPTSDRALCHSAETNTTCNKNHKTGR
jgi:hypothetical protein